jgi:hypothetical protein
MSRSEACGAVAMSGIVGQSYHGAVSPTAPPLAAPAAASAHGEVDLWKVYDQALKAAKYIDLTHTLTPGSPVWKGFGPAVFGPAVDPSTGLPYT